LQRDGTLALGHPDQATLGYVWRPAHARRTDRLRAVNAYIDPQHVG